MPKRKLLIWFAFVAVLFIIYRDCFRIDIPTDSYPLLFTFEKYGLVGLLHNFYDVGMAPFADTVIFLLYKVIGTNSTGWITCSLLLHANNAFLLYLLGEQLFGSFGVKKGELLSLLAALLFLTSPFQTEVLLWVPRILNYSIATSLFILALHFLVRYCTNANKKDLLYLHLCFILALFSFESPLIFPFVGMCCYAFLKTTSTRSISIKSFLLSVLLPQATILIGYFSLCKIWLGDWIVHYGASTHLQFSLPLIAENYIKYFAKFFLFYRYLPESRGEFLHSVLHFNIHDPLHISVMILFCGVALTGTFFLLYKKKKEELLAAVALLGMFMISLLPVINLETSFTGAVISDRYGYLPSASVYLFLPLAINMLLGKLGNYLSASLIAISIFCLSLTIPLWLEADDYCKRLVKNVEPLLNTDDKLYVLNMPDNYNWILNFRGGFHEYIFLKQGKDVHEQIEIVSGFFVETGKDSLRVTQRSKTEYLVETEGNRPKFLHAGSWGRSYQTGEYKVDYNEQQSSYLLTFSDTSYKPSLVYVAGDQWRKFKP